MEYLIRIVYNKTRIKNTYSADHFKSLAREIVVIQDFLKGTVKTHVRLGSNDAVFIMNAETGKTIDKWIAPIDPDEREGTATAKS